MISTALKARRYLDKYNTESEAIIQATQCLVLSKPSQKWYWWEVIEKLNTMDKDIIRFRKAVKLILLLQATLEQMDELKNTRVYRQDIKQSMTNLEKKIERFINPHIEQLGNTEEFMMMQIGKRHRRDSKQNLRRNPQ